MEIKTTRSAGSLLSPIRAYYSLEPQGSLNGSPTAFIHKLLLKQLVAILSTFLYLQMDLHIP